MFEWNLPQNCFRNQESGIDNRNFFEDFTVFWNQTQIKYLEYKPLKIKIICIHLKASNMSNLFSVSFKKKKKNNKIIKS